MDIVLKEPDIIRLLGTAMELTLSPQDVTIHYKPLSVTIANAEQYLAKRENTLPRKTIDPPEERSAAFSSESAPLLSLEDIARANADLVANPPKVTSSRRLRANEMLEPPPPSGDEGEM